MNNITYKTIKNRLLKYKRGRIIFPNNFRKLGSTEAAIRQALHRLAKKGLLVRLSHGIYLYPKKDKKLGILYPSIDEIAKAIAKRDKAKIIPTGSQALNKLGLSTQVPMKIVYLTNGAPRKIVVANRTITFKKTIPKNLLTKGEIATLVIQGLKAIGKNNIDNEHIEKIQDILKMENRSNLINDAKLAPAWISKILLENTK